MCMSTIPSVLLGPLYQGDTLTRVAQCHSTFFFQLGNGAVLHNYPEQLRNDCQIAIVKVYTTGSAKNSTWSAEEEGSEGGGSAAVYQEQAKEATPTTLKVAN